MKYLRNTLLMILAAALIMPSPLVLAEGVSSATQVLVRWMLLNYGKLL